MLHRLDSGDSNLQPFISLLQKLLNRPQDQSLNLQISISVLVDRSRLLVRQEGHDEARAVGRFPPDGHESSGQRPKRDFFPVPSPPQHPQHRSVRRRNPPTNLHFGSRLALQGGFWSGHCSARYTARWSFAPALQRCSSKQINRFLRVIFKTYHPHLVEN